MFHYMLLGATFAFAAVVQPGPFQTYLISQTLTKGWRRTMPAALAPLLSDGPIILLVLLILLHVPGWLVSALQLAGGVFLLYLAFGAWKTWRTFDAKGTPLIQSGQQTLFRAALINLLNPNPYIAWSLVMGPLLLKSWREAPVNGIGLLGSFYLTMVLGMGGTILLFAGAGNLGSRVRRSLIGISAAALAGFAVYEFWSGIHAFWK